MRKVCQSGHDELEQARGTETRGVGWPDSWYNANFRYQPNISYRYADVRAYYI